MGESPRESSSKVGLFGLGNMGMAVASRLAQRWPVVAFDPNPSARASAADLGVEVVSSPEEVVASVVVLSLPSPAVSESVLDPVLATNGPGTLVIETSTVNPDAVQRWDERARQGGASMIDAAILSGVAQMRSGTSTLLVGGADDQLERARPVLESMCEDVRHLGPVGSGMAAKVINNAVAHAVMVVLVEAGALATAAGLPGQALADLLATPDAGLIRPLTHRFAERILHGDFEGGMPMTAARKDSTLALELAQQHRVPLFATQAAHTVYELALGHGLDRYDYAAIATLWEGWTGHSFTAETKGTVT
jgi:3-hydroxyisobutyrate dehydrogenase-like beta-hydroxyacid dehydrogenase